jgi:hypothetical protein
MVGCWWKVGVFVCLLMVLIVGVHAEGEVVSAQGGIVTTDMSSANRFLAAENAKAIDKMQQNVVDALIKNNDDNVRILDQRVAQMEADTKQRVIIGGVGAILIANALIGIVYVWATRRYSYEHFLEKMLQRKVAEMKLPEAMPAPAVIPMSQGQMDAAAPTWVQPVPEQTVSTMLGQQTAANLSDMNQWQFNPAYEGSWSRPGNVVSQVNWESAHKEEQPPRNPWEQEGYQ